MSTVISGATGFIGRALIDRLHKVTVLSRSPERAAQDLGSSVRCVAWDPQNGPPKADAFENCSAVIHLAGEPVAAGRWTDERKKRIEESRIVGTRNLVGRLLLLPEKPKLLISASAIGYYGETGDAIVTEEQLPGDDFLAKVCIGWEHEAFKASEAGIRVITLRIGIVLSREGGALERMLAPFRLGLGGPLGDGSQWMSWIHRNDLIELLLFCLNHDSLSGPVNAVSPAPVINSEFSRMLAAILHRPAFLSVPRLALELLFGEMASVLLTSQRVIPRIALDNGFSFHFPELGAALEDIISSSR